jgi:hypothetical protein
MQLKAWASAAAFAVAGGAIVLAPGNMPAAHAQQSGTRLVATPGDAPEVVRVTRGGRLTLPMSGITRIIPADEDVVRGIFDGGKAQVEGISPGTTLVEVHQGQGKRQLISVQVEDTASIPRLAQNTGAAAKPVATQPGSTAPKAATGTAKRQQHEQTTGSGTVVTPLPRCRRWRRCGLANGCATQHARCGGRNRRRLHRTIDGARPDSSGSPALTVPGRSASSSPRCAWPPVDDNPLARLGDSHLRQPWPGSGAT